jgi:hypothetical protein
MKKSPKSPFSSAAFRQTDQMRRGGAAKRHFLRGSGAGKQQYHPPGKSGACRLDRVQRKKREGGGPALTAPGAFDQPSGRSIGTGEACSRRSSPEGFWELPSGPLESRGGRMRGK